MFFQLLSLIGAAMILGAYLAYQAGWLGRQHRSYHALNLFGSALLAWVAIVDVQWGFIVLETVWAAVSLPGLIRPPARIGD